MGANLVSIHSAAENAFVLEAIKRSNQSYVLIGLSDTASEGDFVWQDGSPVDYTNWDSGEPNDYNGEDYTEMRNSGVWNDVNNSARHYIIEMPSELNIEQTEGLASGSVFPLGITTNSFKVTDASGNVTECSFTVNVEDNFNPVVKVKDITVELDETGEATISATDLDNGSSDNCGIDYFNLSKTTFSCTDIGENQVEMQAVDINGNISGSRVYTLDFDEPFGTQNWEENGNFWSFEGWDNIRTYRSYSGSDHWILTVSIVQMSTILSQLL